MLASRLAPLRCFARPCSSKGFQDGLEEMLTPSAPAHDHLDFLVVHPKIRWGSKSPSVLREPKLQLEEAIALVGTIPSFRVVNSVIVGTDYNTKKARIWGEGRLQEVLSLREQTRASAIMFNVDRLTPTQQSELSSVFRCPIYDRFNVVLSIFKLYARDDVARLQIALAQIPYLKQRLNRLRTESAAVLLPGLHENSVVRCPDELRMREQWLRKRLNDAIGKETKEREQHSKRGSLVAVVGYTNAGKTSLIKRLTGSPSLRPLDRLFATLHTSEHSARLPSGRPVTLADTIGFLYDLPVDLLAAFEATLRHVTQAAAVVHVRDVSHPDWKAHNEEVQQTMERLGMGEEERRRVITVDNKIDKGGSSGDSSAVRISCKTGEGVAELVERVDEEVRRATGTRPRRLVLPFDSPSIQYLYGEGLVVDEPTTDERGLVFTVQMTDEEFERFKKQSRERKRVMRG